MENKRAKWISNYLNVSSIDTPEYEELKNFAILWNLFENVIFGTSYKSKDITQKLSLLQIDQTIVDQTYSYMKKRYTANGCLNKTLYDSLKLRPKADMPQLVKNVLLTKSNVTQDEIIIAITIIIYRYRCNLFHGSKPMQSISSQKDNLICANDFLIAWIKGFNNTSN